jgi:hypothetical protein
MKWRKLGLVFSPPGDVDKAFSHAQIPTPLLLNDEVLRVYYSARDELGRSRPYYVDVASKNPLEIVGYSKKPLLDLGPAGCFDDNGAVTCSVVKHPDGRFFMYYVGFELHQHVRYKLFTGLAISTDGDTFERCSNVPVLDRSDADFCFRCGPFVRRFGDGFEMYYVAGSEWVKHHGKDMPIYVIKRILSKDGLHWPDDGPVVIGISQPDEHGFGRPWVLPASEGMEMYYSVRRISFNAYRMGWATSADGMRWNRRDEEIGLDVSPGYFDSQAIMYAAVIDLHGKRYCFYNGDDFGAAGFAVAVQEAS